MRLTEQFTELRFYYLSYTVACLLTAHLQVLTEVCIVYYDDFVVVGYRLRQLIFIEYHFHDR